MAAFYLAYQDKQSLIATVRTSSQNRMTSQPFGNLHQCFQALRLIILYKTNPGTRSVHDQIWSKLFFLQQERPRKKQFKLYQFCKVVLRINQDPEAEAPHTGLLGDFSWNWEQEPTKKISRTKPFRQNGHFF